MSASASFMRRWLSGAALAAAVGIAPFAASAQVNQAQFQQGTVSVGAPSVVILNNVPQAAAGVATAAPSSIPLRTPSKGTLAAAKSVAASGNSALAGSEPVPAPGAPPSSAAAGGPATPGASLTFPGTTETGCSGGGQFWTPADQALAVGPTYVVQATNSCINIFTKNGFGIKGYPKDMYAFLGLPSWPSAFLSDPRAVFDWVNNRYIVTLI